VGGVVSGALAVWVEEAVDPAGVAQQQLVVRPARVLLVLTCTAALTSRYHTEEKQITLHWNQESEQMSQINFI
jgi:hypothetical protein